MNQYKKSYELKNAAKDKLEGKYGGAILIFFLSTLLSSVIRLFIDVIASASMNTIYTMTGSMSAAMTISIVFDAVLLLAAVLMGVMNVGIALYFLNLACGQPRKISNLFYGFQTDQKNALVVTTAVVLCQTVCLWPGHYLLQQYTNTRENRWLLYAAIALIIGLCIYIPISLGITMSYYLMLDFPQNSGGRTLALCWHIMKGHRRRLFCLELSFLPLILLCVCSFGIGFLWLYPYMQMTYTCFFLDLMNPAKQ